MSNHPINLLLRFILELAAWAAMGYWGWVENDGVLRFAAAIGLPLLAMILWGVFRVDGYPGKAPVRVPGPLRLALELAEFGLATLLLVMAGAPVIGVGFGIVVLIHYAFSYDYFLTLLKTP